MNIESATDDDQAEESEYVNENAMYNPPAPDGPADPGLLNLTTRSEFNSTLDQVTEPVLTEEEIFYRSYNPLVGLHTAAVLGGILGLVIIYLVYRTKIRKAVIRFIRSRRKKDKVFSEPGHMGKFLPCPEEQRSELLEPPAVISGKEQKFFGKDFVIDQIQASIECQKLIVNEHNYSPTIVDDQHSKWKDTEISSPGILLPPCNLSSVSVTTFDPKLVQQQQQHLIQKLPSVETDIVKATAQWVQDQPLSSQSTSFQDISGVILKVQPHVVRNHIPGSCPLDSLTSRTHLTPVPLTWNKSMPILCENLHVSSENLKVEHKTNYKEEKRCKAPPNLTIPIPDLKEFASASHLAYSPVPIPVTPTVMIQNFTSKGSTKKSQLQRHHSTDSLTSNSSEDPLLSSGPPSGVPPSVPLPPGSAWDSLQINTSPPVRLDSMETTL